MNIGAGIIGSVAGFEPATSARTAIARVNIRRPTALYR